MLWKKIYIKNTHIKKTLGKSLKIRVKSLCLKKIGKKTLEKNVWEIVFKNSELFETFGKKTLEIKNYKFQP